MNKWKRTRGCHRLGWYPENPASPGSCPEPGPFEWPPKAARKESLLSCAATLPKAERFSTSRRCKSLEHHNYKTPPPDSSVSPAACRVGLTTYFPAFAARSRAHRALAASEIAFRPAALI